MMAFDEGNPGPPPAPVARLPRLPSNAEIVRPHNADASLLILRAVLSRGAHRPGGHTYREVAALLWEIAYCYRPFLWQVPGMGPSTNPEKYEGEGLFRHRTLFRVRVGSSATPLSAAAIGLAAPQ